MRSFEEHYDQPRKLLLQELRGATGHNADVVLPSHNARADMGYIILGSTEYPLVPGITNTAFAGPLHHEQDEDGAEMIRSRNATVVPPGWIGRSPCGTGTSARLRRPVPHGLLEQGQLFRHEPLVGSGFDARVESTTTVGLYDAVVPSISGRAWITSFDQLVLDPTDPFQNGFVVGRPREPEV